MSRRENASSRLKLQPHIYYVYVYKSLRRPHIPEACKVRGQRDGGRERQRNGGWGPKRRCVKSSPEVEPFWLLYTCNEVLKAFIVVGFLGHVTPGLKHPAESV